MPTAKPNSHRGCGSRSRTGPRPLAYLCRDPGSYGKTCASLMHPTVINPTRKKGVLAAPRNWINIRNRLASTTGPIHQHQHQHQHQHLHRDFDRNDSLHAEGMRNGLYTKTRPPKGVMAWQTTT